MAKAGSTTARGYGYGHQRLRRQWAHIVNTGQAYCTICGQWIVPGTTWHLDHDDNRDFYRGAAHATCNLTAGARKGYAAQQRSLAIRRAMRTRW